MNFLAMPQTELLITTKCNMGCTYCFEKVKSNKTMSKSMIDEFVKQLPSKEIMLFGGEPFLAIEEITYLYDEIEKSDLTDEVKQRALKSFTTNSAIITNATLIEKNLDIIKKYNLKFQISIDGPEELNDLCRIYKDGSGTYSDIMKNIQICIDNDINWVIHGAVARNNLINLSNLFDFYWDMSKRQNKNDLEKAIASIGSNIFQFTFEDEYTDEDIDTLLLQQEEIFTKIMSMSELSIMHRNSLAIAWFKRRGSGCIAGNRMIAYDDTGAIYGCHRFAMKSDSSKYTLENNVKLFNSLMALSREQTMYSVTQNIINWGGNLFQQNWCPAANMETSGTVRYQSAKYNTLIAEYGRFVEQLFDYANL